MDFHARFPASSGGLGRDRDRGRGGGGGDGVATGEHDVDDFLAYMTSAASDAASTTTTTMTTDLGFPMVNYFINSSHNTYLTGNQLYSECSTEAYTNVRKRILDFFCYLYTLAYIYFQLRLFVLPFQSISKSNVSGAPTWLPLHRD